MNIIKKSNWVGLTVCFGMTLMSAAPCPAQDAGDERSLRELFEQELSVRIKRDRVKSKELRKRGLVDESGAADIDFDGFIYKLDFRNGAPVSFDHLNVECRFFYSKATSGASSPMGGNTGLRDPVVEYQSEEMSCSVKGEGRYKTKTRAFIIQSWRLPGGYYFEGGRPNRQECDGEGVWVRVTYTLPDGRTLQRDFSEPESLCSRLSWDLPKIKNSSSPSKKNKQSSDVADLNKPIILDKNRALNHKKYDWEEEVVDNVSCLRTELSKSDVVCFNSSVPLGNQNEFIIRFKYKTSDDFFVYEDKEKNRNGSKLQIYFGFKHFVTDKMDGRWKYFPVSPQVDWTPIEWKVKIPEGATTRLSCQIALPKGKGDFYLSDVEVLPVPDS
jgi:hypothetical protein